MALAYENGELEQLCAQTTFDWTTLLELNNIDGSNSLSSFSAPPSPSPNDLYSKESATPPQMLWSNGVAQIGNLMNCSSPHKSDQNSERQLRRKLQNREAQRKSRDRRKDKISQLAEQLRNSTARNQQLQIECATLKSECARLESINGVYMELLQCSLSKEPSASCRSDLPGDLQELADYIPWTDEMAANLLWRAQI